MSGKASIESLAKAARDAFFYAAPERRFNRIPGVRGFHSPSDDPEASKLGFSEPPRDGADSVMRQVFDYFDQRQLAFTWIADPEIEGGLAARDLERAGLERRYEMRLMGLRASDPVHPGETDVRVVELPPRACLEAVVRLSETFHISTEVIRQALFGGGEAPDLSATRGYRAVNDRGETMGVGFLHLMPGSGVATLRYGVVFDPHRGRGAYRSLARRRAQDARALGAQFIVAHADARTSAAILERLGMRSLGRHIGFEKRFDKAAPHAAVSGSGP